MSAYYNEIDEFCAAWLRNLIDAGHIAPGDVDTRSIRDVSPSDIAGYTQCHFFAGIGLWSHALRLAGWPDTRPARTGSCPCQPFSAAGKRRGTADERHLWPDWFRLIRECRPAVLFGEQVASPLGITWLDHVRADVEGARYAFGGGDFPSASVGAPQIRQRLYYGSLDVGVAHGLGVKGDADVERLEGWIEPQRERADQRPAGAGSLAGGLALPDGRDTGDGHQQRGGQHGFGTEDRGDVVGSGGALRGEEDGRAPSCGPGPTNRFWSDPDWLFCRDGKWRPVEGGTFPLAHGDTSRMGKLRAFGNAINAEQACEFIIAFDEATHDLIRSPSLTAPP